MFLVVDTGMLKVMNLTAIDRRERSTKVYFLCKQPIVDTHMGGFILNACYLVNFCALQTVALPCCSLLIHLKVSTKNST